MMKMMGVPKDRQQDQEILKLKKRIATLEQWIDAIMLKESEGEIMERFEEFHIKLKQNDKSLLEGDDF